MSLRMMILVNKETGSCYDSPLTIILVQLLQQKHFLCFAEVPCLNLIEVHA